ncbi:MAG: Cof-type HAD-IIB family hydrolase [Cellulophaga sp.]
MSYKVLCSDLDGTLLSTKNDVSDFTITEIKRIKEDIRIILTSARMPKSMTYLQQRMGITNMPIICYNGALVLDGSKQVFSKTIDIITIEKIYQLAEENNIKLGLYHKDEWCVEETTERVVKEILHTKTTPIYRSTKETVSNWKHRTISAHKIMLMGTEETTDAVFPKLEKMFASAIHIYRSNATLIELTPKSVSKLSAIKLLLKENETLQDVIAFGDNYNDMEMLQHVHCGVAVGNAREEVKAIANKVTLKNTEHGVAYFIAENIS